MGPIRTGLHLSDPIEAPEMFMKLMFRSVASLLRWLMRAVSSWLGRYCGSKNTHCAVTRISLHENSPAYGAGVFLSQ